MEHPIRELSGGQKAKLFFMKMSLEENDVLILDEPTRNFSPMSNPVIRNILANYQGAILCISHDRKFIEEVCTKVYRLTGTDCRRWKRKNSRNEFKKCLTNSVRIFS